ncbi:hypothetical protein G5S52_12650 [Grimontia sp. S25]|uniref:Polysaccharide biosynthesis protein n=1 Tax=Grimontia sedimenti TaxID=2711294 RepID=A0A6M1RDS0_9GAMM|nr:hypothetical protein [Grimontia sedimenti]NGN98466.1 hypothetical protein [Grimontia sedimenti]
MVSTLTVADYGKWTAVYFFVRLSPYLHFGALSYFNKRYPYTLGKQISTKNVENFTKTSLKLIAYLILLVGSISVFFVEEPLYCFLLSLVATSMLLYTFYQSKFRCDGRFYYYTSGLILYAFSQLILAYILVSRYGIAGGLVSILLAYTFAVMFYYLIDRKVKRNWSDDRNPLRIKRLRKVVTIGWPYFLLTISSFIVQSSDRIALILYGNDIKLAYYGFFFIFMQIGIIFINSVGKIIGPGIINLIGGGEIKNVDNIENRTLFSIMLMHFVLCIFWILFGDLIINSYFGKFNGSTPGAFSYYCIGIMSSISIIFYPKIVALNKERFLIGFNIIHSLFLTSILYIFLLYSDGVFNYAYMSIIINFIFYTLFFIVTSKLFYINLKKVLFANTLVFISFIGFFFYVWD